MRSSGATRGGVGGLSLPWAWRGRRGQRGHRSSGTRPPVAWGWGHKPRSPLLPALAVRKPEGGGTHRCSPQRPASALSSGGRAGGPRQWTPPHPEGRMCPCSFPTLGGLDERPQGEDSGGRGSADRAGGVARAGSGNPRGRCPQHTRIPFSGKQAVTCPGHTRSKRQRWIQGPLLPKEGACAESNHSALCKTKTAGLIRPCLVPNQ